MTSILFISYFIYNSASAEESNGIPEPEIIEKLEEDVTGDNIKESITLKGIPFSEDSTYYRDIWIDLSNIHSNEWSISYEGGYDPTIQFIDLNHDGVNDIFYQSSSGGSGGLYYYHLHTLKNEKIKSLSLPNQQYVKGKFIDQYKIEIQISPDQQPIVVDVADQAKEYERLNIYNQEGTLIKPTPVIIDPIAFFEPIVISKDKGYGLKSYKQISGANHADKVGTIETLWYFDHDQWIILQSKWVPAR